MTSRATPAGPGADDTRPGSEVPDTVARAAQALVLDLDDTVPGAADGVYLVGSAALGDFHPGSSDVDLVVVLGARPDALVGRLLDDVHTRVEAAHGDVRFDIVYSTWADLRTPPRRGDTLALARRGGRTLTGDDATPSVLTWHQLHDHGIALSGPEVGERQIATDPEGLRAVALTEIARHWTPWWDRAAVLLSAGGRESLGAVGPTSGVLGATRLHHTLVTGRLLAQCAAGEWALTICEPEWARILRESLRVRHDPGAPSLYRNPLQRRRDALDYMDLLMTADEEAFGGPPTTRTHSAS